MSKAAQTDTDTGRQTGRQACMQTGRQAGKQEDTKDIAMIIENVHRFLVVWSHWTNDLLAAALETLSHMRVGAAHMGFSERIDTILNWTELNMRVVYFSSAWL